MDWNIAIVDDLQLDRLRLEKDVAKWFRNQDLNAEIHTYKSGPDMLAEFSPNAFDLAFFDIRMDDMTGIQLAEKVREQDAGLLICFLTTSREYAFDAFPIHPFDYLIKPYKEDQLNHVLAEAQRLLSGSEPEITVKISRGEYSIPYGHIVSAASEGHFVNFTLKDGSIVKGITTFNFVESQLTKDERFLLCNRGVLVNMDHVSSMESDAFVMNDGSSFPLRTKGRIDLIKKFSKYQISRLRRGR